MNRYEKVDSKMKELYANTFNNMDTPERLSRKVLTMRNNNTNTKKKIRISIKVAIAVAVAVAVAVGGSIITFASKGYKGQYQKVYLNGEEVSSRYGKLSDYCFTFEIIDDNQTSYSVWLHGEYIPDSDTLHITDMGDYIIASLNEEPTLNLYDEIGNSPYGELIDNETGTFIDVPIILNGEQANTAHFNLSNDEKDGAKDGLIDNKFEYPNSDDTYITSYTLAPNGSIIQAFKGPLGEDNESMEMMWGLIWGEESSETIEKYAQEHDN